MYSSIVDAIYEHSLHTPEKLAIADSKRAYSYRELMGAILFVADRLKEKGVTKGDYVLVECNQRAEFVILDFACEYIEAVFVPFEKKAVEARVKQIYEDTSAKLLLCETNYEDLEHATLISEVCDFASPKAKELMEQACLEGDKPVTSGDTLAEILFSTGTTGAPKGICLSNKANVAIAENIMYGTQMQAHSVELIPLPLSHSHGLRTCYANFLNGSAVVVIDGIMNVSLFFKLMEEYQVNALDISPTLAKLLLKIAKRGLREKSSVIEYIEIGTAVLEDDTKNQLKEIFTDARLYNFYGSTEAGRSCVLNFNETDYSSCIGRPSRNATFYIVDDDRKVMESSKENPGTIAVSGAMMMDGYFKAQELTRETLVNGIIYTSDLGYIDENGLIYVLGRKDDVINYKGIKIAPEEVESVALTFDGILDCACVPMEDPVCGQAPKLFIKVKDDKTFDEKAYMDFLRGELEISRVPKALVVIDDIPHSSNGKLQRKKLRDLK